MKAEERKLMPDRVAETGGAMEDGSLGQLLGKHGRVGRSSS